jgi:hypothetical protein
VTYFVNYTHPPNRSENHHNSESTVFVSQEVGTDPLSGHHLSRAGIALDRSPSLVIVMVSICMLDELIDSIWRGIIALEFERVGYWRTLGTPRSLPIDKTFGPI